MNGKIEKIEIRRKIVHLSTLIIPITYSLTSSRELILKILIPFFIIYLTIDILRRVNLRIASIFRKYFYGKVLRDKEAISLMGSTYFLFSTILTIILYPKDIAIVSILFLTISDTIAAWVGKLLGGIKIFEKTVEGSVAFFITSILIILIYPDINLFQGILGAFGATVIEVLPLKIDDNLTIPIGSGAIMFFSAGL